MEYTELECRISPLSEESMEILCAELVEFGYESFVETETGVNAYIPSKNFDITPINELLTNNSFDFEVQFFSTAIPDQNWNEVWEKNYFQPIVIGDKCLIKSPFHQTDVVTDYTIVIEPKMSFGTGHHATTSLMLEQILHLNLHNKHVLDMGCGTGVLAILAAMRGANPILAIDIDDWAYNNSIENCAKNNVPQIEVKIGDATLLEGLHFDIILANINRNILVADIQHYALCLSKGGLLLMSGFYSEDIAIIDGEAKMYGFELRTANVKDNWAVTIFEKLV